MKNTKNLIFILFILPLTTFNASLDSTRLGTRRGGKRLDYIQKSQNKNQKILGKRQSAEAQKKEVGEAATKGQSNINFGKVAIVAIGVIVCGVVLFFLSNRVSLDVDQQAKVLTNCNFYKEKNPYEVIKIDWNNSTLDPQAIASLNADSDNIKFSKDGGKHAWPAYVTMKLGSKGMYNNDDWIKACYKDPYDIFTEDEIVQEVKDTKDLYYFHSVSSLETCKKIIETNAIKVTHRRFSPGAFVGAGKIADNGGFGHITFGFKRELEFFDFPLTHRNIGKEPSFGPYPQYYVGFWQKIPVKEYLSEIFIKKGDMNDNEFNQLKQQIRSALNQAGYPASMPISQEKTLLSKGSTLYWQNRSVVIPKCWLAGEVTGMGVSFQRDKNNELKADENTVIGKIKSMVFGTKLKQLYSNKPVELLKIP